MKTNILFRFLSATMASFLLLGLFPISSNAQAQTQVKGTTVTYSKGMSYSGTIMSSSNAAIPNDSSANPQVRQCIPGYVTGSDGSCVRTVKFFKWPSKTLAQARSLAKQKNWELATRQQVTEAWQKAGLNVFAFGRTSTGDMCVPVQKPVSTFKRGANCGDNRGNQGFFYVVNYNNPFTLNADEKKELTKVVTEVSFGPQAGEKGLFRQVGPKAWQYRTGGRPNDKLAASCVESSRGAVTVLLSCENNKYQYEINLENYNIFKIEGGRKSNHRIGGIYAIVRYTDYYPVILDKDLKNLKPFSESEIKKIMLWISKETSNSRIDYCYKARYGRGVGAPLSRCSSGTTEQNSLCYQNCRNGFSGAGPVCWGKCPAGFSDIGAFCQKRGEYTREGFGWRVGDPLLPNYSGPRGRCERKYGRNNCEQKGAVIYPKCKPGFKQTIVTKCAPSCPAGWADTGTGCTKPSYGRGAGKPMVCAPGQERGTEKGVGLLCYPQCKTGYKGNGPMCWQNCNTSSTGNQRHDCGVGCARDINACVSVLTDQISAPIMLVIGLFDMGISARAKSLASAAARGATGGAAAASGGVTAVALKDTPKWSKLFNSLKEADNWARAEQITNVTSLAMDAANVGKGLRAEIEHWNDEFEQEFAQNTSPEIEREIRRRFDYNTQRIIKRTYATYHLSSMLESDGWRIGKLALSVAAPIAGIIGDPGFLAVIAAYAHPSCNPPGGNPFPNVTPKKSVNQRNTARRISVNQSGTAGSNVAKGKTARQSSTAFGGNASRAVDGNTDGKWGNNSVTHTNAERQAWLEVDLGASYNIDEIKLHNRTDCCSNRLNSYRILVSERSFTSNSGTVFSNSSSFQNVNPRTFRGNARGRYVRIHLNGSGYLSLAEVEVMGRPNVATGNTATPSSTSGKGWKQIGGSLKHVSVGSDGTTWGVNSADNIFRWTGSTWIGVSGKLKQISVGSASHVWGVNAADNIYRWTGSTWANVPGRLKHVSVGSDGTVWGVNAADVIYRRTGNTWTNVPGRLKQISVGSASQVWGVNSADQIFQWTGTTWKNISGRLKYVSVGSDGTVWGVNAANKIYRRTGSTWANVPGDLKQISAGASNQVWGVYIRNGGIYTRTF